MKKILSAVTLLAITALHAETITVGNSILVGDFNDYKVFKCTNGQLTTATTASCIAANGSLDSLVYTNGIGNDPFEKASKKARKIRVKPEKVTFKLSHGTTVTVTGKWSFTYRTIIKEESSISYTKLLKLLTRTSTEVPTTTYEYKGK